MDSTSPPSSSNSFPVPVAVAVGFVATAAVLIGYYLFVLRFWLNGHHPGLRQVTPYSRRGRNREDDGGGDMPPAFFIDEHDGGGGVDPSIVNSIPIIKFIKSGGQILECAVCLSEFQEEESLKLLRSCSHAFHIQCIDTWLKTNANCPLCRANVSKPIQMPVLASISQQLLSSEQVLTPVADDEASNQTPGDRNWCRISKVESMRDVSIEFREPIRRSFSMDHLHLNDHRKSLGESSISVRGGGDGSGRFRRLFGLGRSSRNAVLPIQIDQ